MIIERPLENFYKIKWMEEYLIGHNGFIAGGCFKNAFNNENIKDLDIFFRSETDYIWATRYYDALCGEKNNGIFRFYYENDKVKAYKHSDKNIVVELIRGNYGTPEEVLNKFDFTITKFAFYREDVPSLTEENETVSEYRIIHDDKFFEHLHLNRLVVDNQLLFPISSFERMIRYIKYGYLPCKETKKKLLEGIRSVPAITGLAESLYEGMD